MKKVLVTIILMIVILIGCINPVSDRLNRIDSVKVDSVKIVDSVKVDSTK